MDDLLAEVAVERATTLAQLGRRLDATIARLRAIETDPMTWEDRVAAHRAARAELGELRWEMTVVKEAMGVKGVRADLDRFWPMPRPLHDPGPG